MQRTTFSSVAWSGDARKLVDEIIDALIAFMSTTGLDTKVLTSENRRFVMAGSSVLVTQIVARALTKAGVPDVSVDERLFRVNHNTYLPALFGEEPGPGGYRPLHVVEDRTSEGLGKVLPHSVLRVDGVIVDLLAPALGNGRSNVPFAWEDDGREREHPDHTGTYVKWRTKASARQNELLHEKLEDMLEEQVFKVMLPYYEPYEITLANTLRGAIDKFATKNAAQTKA